MRTHTLGIDLHKNTSAWVLLDDKHNEIWKDSVGCRPDNIITAVEDLPVLPAHIQVALEPVCGWRWVMSLLEEAGMEVHPAHPYKVRLIAESTQKHDVGDARMLARLLQSGYYPEAHRVSNETFDLRLLLRERSFLIEMRTRAKNRLHGIATTVGYGHNPLNKGTEKLLFEQIPPVCRELIALIAELTRRIQPFDRQVIQVAKQYPLVTILTSMPAIGTLTALTIIAEVESFDRFPTAGKLASYAGLIPSQRSSGGKTRLGSITRQGSPRLRTAMVEAALRIRHKNAPELLAFVERLAPTCGKKRARVALARKMLTILWAMVHTNTPYNPLSSCVANQSDLVTKRGA